LHVEDQGIRRAFINPGSPLLNVRNLRGVNIQRIADGGNDDTRLLVRQGNAKLTVYDIYQVAMDVHTHTINRRPFAVLR